MYFFAIFDKQKSVEMVKIFFIMEEAAKSARSKNHCRVSFPIPRHVGDYVWKQTDFLLLRGLFLPHCKGSIYAFPEKELGGLSPNFRIHVFVSDLYE